MTALINLYIDPKLNLGWMKCSELAEKAAGWESFNHAQNLHQWVVSYMQHGTLPLNNNGCLYS